MLKLPSLYVILLLSYTNAYLYQSTLVSRLCLWYSRDTIGFRFFIVFGKGSFTTTTPTLDHFLNNVSFSQSLFLSFYLFFFCFLYGMENIHAHFHSILNKRISLVDQEIATFLLVFHFLFLVWRISWSSFDSLFSTVQHFFFFCLVLIVFFCLNWSFARHFVCLLAFLIVIVF